MFSVRIPGLGLPALVALAMIGLPGAIPAAHAGYSDAVLADSPVSYWRLNESSGAGTATDEQSNFPGTYQDGTDGGGAGPRPADFPGFNSGNGAATLNGDKPGYIATELDSAALSGSYPFTLEMWGKTTETDNWMLTISDESAGVQSYGIGLQNGHARAYAYNGSFDDADGTSTVNDGNWHYFAATFETNSGEAGDYKVSLYVDPTGTTPAATTAHNNDFVSDLDGTNIGALVRNTEDSDGQSRTTGQIDEVAVYSGALSGSQILNHYQTAVIPEPASMTLLLGAGGALLATRRRHGRAGS